jgi:hypothetical protein
MATRVTLPASRFAPVQEARHGQPSVIADVRQRNMKRPIIEYVLIGVGFIICIASLITATLDLGHTGFPLFSHYWLSSLFACLGREANVL